MNVSFVATQLGLATTLIQVSCFDGYKDPYQTTDLISLQLEVEDLQSENVDVVMLMHSLTIHNCLYTYLAWTNDYAPFALVSACSYC